MKLRVLLGLAFWSALFLFSCKNDDISFEEPAQSLRFSADTVFCDTVYNQMRSETYAVKVYNKENKDVQIPRIYLESGNASLYRINVDGRPGTDFKNVPLRKNDSLYVFVEIAPVANAPEAIAEDKVVFQTAAGEQKVTLFSVVQDAEYFIQSDSNPNILSDDTTWNNNKAKIIFGDLTLAEGKKLTVEKGTKVYFHKKSGLNISKSATLEVKGELNHEVIFRGDRNDARYDTLPANWNGIRMEESSQLHMNYAKVYGGNVGLQLQDNDATITNTIIHTFQSFGIYAIGANLTTNNLVMNNCGEADLAIFKGGNYNLTYSTFANYWDLNGALSAYSIYASNSWSNGGQNYEGPLNFKMTNSIAYNDNINAILFAPKPGQIFDYNISNCLIKYGDNAGYTFENNNKIQNSIKNIEPKFANYYIQKMNLRVKEGSGAIGKGVSIPGNTMDIVGVARKNPSTIGAYEF
ncbi:hypothetical protein [Soonwooa purpurea]